MGETRLADGKGRVTLGAKFANRHLIIDEIGEGEVLIRRAVVVPEGEVWLMENNEAKDLVIKGIEEAKNNDFVKGPDLEADLDLCEDMDEE